MSVGDEMLDKMRRRPPAAGHDVWVDDNGSTARSTGSEPSTADKATDFPALGNQTRPNGTVYHPRTVMGFEDVALLRDARDHKEHILFYGPPGTGKTALCEAAFSRDATADHEGMESIVGTADTTEHDFLGTFVQNPRTGAFEWRPGPLHRSVMNDVPLLVDEIALIDPRVLSVLYPLMDGRNLLRIPVNPDLEPLPVGKGWFVMGAFNPDVPGARMSEALRDRFVHHVEVGTDWEMAQGLGVPEEMISVAKNLDQRRREGDLTWSPQLRSLLAYAETERRRGREYALANLLGKVPADDRDVVHGVLTQKFGVIHRLRLGKRFES
jgi:nitric oxide reductase NorQ protein